MNHFWKLVTKTRILSKEMMIIRQKPVPNFEEEEDNNRDNNVDEETCESNKEEYSMVVHQDKPEFIENKRLWSQETGSVHPGAGESSGTPVRMLADQLETQLSHWSGSVSRNCLTRASSRGDVLTEYSDLQLLIPDRDNVDASGNVERFIAVPVSPSYLTDHLRSLHQTSINMSSLQHTPDTGLQGAGPLTVWSPSLPHPAHL